MKQNNWFFITLKIIKIFFQNIRFFWKLSLLSVTLGILSLGILLPVFQTGFGYIFFKLYKGESVYYKDIFKFVNKTFLLFILGFISIIIFAISIIGIFLPVFIIAFFMYSPYILVDENAGIFKSLWRSCEMVVKNGFFKHLMITIFLIIFFLIGLLPFGLGVFITFPLISGYIGVMYAEYKNVK